MFYALFMENWIQQKFDIDLSFPKSRGLGKIHVDPFFHKNSDLYNPGQSSNTVRDFFWCGSDLRPVSGEAVRPASPANESFMCQIPLFNLPTVSVHSTLVNK